MIDSVDNESLVIQDGSIGYDNTLPSMKEGTEVYISNKEHPLNLEQGIITDRSVGFYRLKLVSQNSVIHNTCLWIHEHWVSLLPKELKHVKNVE